MLHSIDMVAKCSTFFSIVLLFTFALQAQEINTKKSTWGIAAGVMGVWLNNEIRLSENFTWRNEAGIEMTNWTISYQFYSIRDKEPIIPFVFTTEPRFYFSGLSKKESLFLSLKTSYHPPFLLFSKNQYSAISILPVIAARYKIGNNFNLEMGGGGPGYKYVFKHKNPSTLDIGGQWAFDVILKFGYLF